jgi:ribosomal protein S12 methylthiotransferase accessory factor YcaO
MGSVSGRIDYQVVADFLSPDFSLWEIADAQVPVFLSVAAPRADGVTGLKPRLPSGRGLWRSQSLMSAAAEALELVSILARPEHIPGEIVVNGTGQHCCRAIHVFTGAELAVPAQEAILDYAGVTGEQAVAEADTSGCAAELSRAEALQRAALELIERDALSAWWHGQHMRPRMPLGEALLHYPRLLAHCERRSRQTVILDISTDIPVACAAAVSWDEKGRKVAIGSAAHQVFEIAALNALTEMFQTEVSCRAAGSSNADLDNWTQTVSIATFPHLCGADRSSSSLYHQHNLQPTDALRHAGFDVYSIDFSLADAPLHVMRAIVPGLTGLGRHRSRKRILQLRERRNWRTGPQGDDLVEIDPF